MAVQKFKYKPLVQVAKAINITLGVKQKNKIAKWDDRYPDPHEQAMADEAAVAAAAKAYTRTYVKSLKWFNKDR